MTLCERTRPKGYKVKVWEHCYAEAERDKAWALDVCLNQHQWFHEASQSSLEWLGKCLAYQPWKLAQEAYDYLEMRAHGQTFLGALDPSAREKWESITGRRISPKRMWKYDHTVGATSARREGKEWIAPSYRRSA